MSQETLLDEPTEVSAEREKFDAAQAKLDEATERHTYWEERWNSDSGTPMLDGGERTQAKIDKWFAKRRKDGLLGKAEQEAHSLDKKQLELYSDAGLAMDELIDFEAKYPAESGQPDTRPAEIKHTHDKLIAKVTDAIRAFQEFGRNELGLKEEKTMSEMWDYFSLGARPYSEAAE